MVPIQCPSAFLVTFDASSAFPSQFSKEFSSCSCIRVGSCYPPGNDMISSWDSGYFNSAITASAASVGMSHVRILSAHPSFPITFRYHIHTRTEMAAAEKNPGNVGHMHIITSTEAVHQRIYVLFVFPIPSHHILLPLHERTLKD